MEKVQIFCEQRALFVHPLDRDVKHKVEPFEFAYVPEWVVKTEFWKMLKQSGKAKEIGTRKDVAEIEKKGKIDKAILSKTLEKAPMIEEAAKETDEEEVEITENTESEHDSGEAIEAVEEKVLVKDMTAKELYKFCIDNNIEVEMKQSKAFYLEKIDEFLQVVEE